MLYLHTQMQRRAASDGRYFILKSRFGCVWVENATNERDFLHHGDVREGAHSDEMRSSIMRYDGIRRKNNRANVLRDEFLLGKQQWSDLNGNYSMKSSTLSSIANIFTGHRFRIEFSLNLRRLFRQFLFQWIVKSASIRRFRLYSVLITYQFKSRACYRRALSQMFSWLNRFDVHCSLLHFVASHVGDTNDTTNTTLTSLSQKIKLDKNRSERERERTKYDCTS